MNSAKKNYLYSVGYQVLTIIVPLITTPYLSRTLGAERIGIYAYTNAIVQYFVLISMMGILDYGNRTIASLRTKEERGQVFEEIYFIQFTTSTIALIIYVMYIGSDMVTYKSIALIQGIAIIASLFDINWFFFGIEKFKTTVTRNFFVKIASLILVFVCVRDSDDLWKYVTITVGGTLVSNLILWFFLKNEVVWCKFSIRKALSHFKPCLILMIPLLSRSIFVYLDKTMLGSMSGMIETGYYEYSEKIVLAVTSLLTPLGTVMLPRISSLLADGNEEIAQKYTALSMDFVVGAGIAFTMGAIAISDTLVYVFLGGDYIECAPIVCVMSLTIILVGWTNVIRTQYILPYKKDKVYILAVALGALVDFIFNFLLIPEMGALGAAIGWVAAEILITLTQTIYARQKLNIMGFLKNEAGFFINSGIMFIFVKMTNIYLGMRLSTLLIDVLVGATIYGSLTLIYIRLFRKDLWQLLIGTIAKGMRHRAGTRGKN